MIFIYKNKETIEQSNKHSTTQKQRQKKLKIYFLAVFYGWYYRRSMLTTKLTTSLLTIYADLWITMNPCGGTM